MAASPRPPSWAIEHSEFNVGDLGDVALPRRVGEKVLRKGLRLTSRGCGTRFRALRPLNPDKSAGRRRGSERKIGYWRLGTGYWGEDCSRQGRKGWKEIQRGDEL